MVNRLDTIWAGSWNQIAGVAGRLFMVIFAGTASLVVRMDIKKQAGIAR